jgi:hypothetical protein
MKIGIERRRPPMAREQAREKIAEHLNWYANPDYKDWVNLTDEQKNIWRARGDDILSLIAERVRKKENPFEFSPIFLDERRDHMVFEQCRQSLLAELEVKDAKG